MPRMSLDVPDNAVYSVADVREFDRRTIAGGVAGFELMKRAAHFALDTALAEHAGARHWAVLCGSGNNAGDGYALATLATAIGVQVDALYLADPEGLTGAARSAWGEAVKSGVAIAPFTGQLDKRVDLIVDGLLGSGLSRQVEGSYAAAVETINAHPAPCLALDIPTGIHGDTGEKLGVAVSAATTATFVGRKTGLYFKDGPDHCGDIHYSDLDAPVEVFADLPPQCLLMDGLLTSAALPARRRQAHKGDFGHVVIVGGGPGMPGAVRLAGEAALRAGAGRVSIATHPDHAASIPATRPELMCHAVDADALGELLASATVMAIGPGLGRSDWARAVFSQARRASLPMVVDADALNLLAANPDRRANRILTPHPGEAGRLLGSAAANVQDDRLAALHQLQDTYGGCVVLKGHGTLISRDGQPPLLCTAGNPGMASAGMGDVLTGVIAGLVAQQLPLETAAAVAVEVHASAADAAAVFGERGLLASDLLEELRPWVNP